MASTQQGWTRKPLGDVADVISGYAFKSSEFGERGVPVIKIKNIRVGSVDLSEADRVDEKFLTIPERYHVRAGDILISLTGSHISQPNSVVGRVARHTACLPTCLLNQRGGKVMVRDRNSCDLTFLFYALSEPETMRAIAMKAHGAASQANVSPTQVESVELPFPPLPVQRRIAGILSAYDELMENSQRRIRLLEAMARALYREWFVHFRFPGHEKLPRIACPLGDIPQGWEVRRIDEALSFDSGRTIKKEERENGDTPVYGANGIIGGTANPPMAERCIIMGKIGSCGALHRSHKPCWVTNNSFLVQPSAIQSLELAWQVLLDVDFRQYIGGAANPYMPINTFGQHEVLIPAESVQSEFERRAGPLRRLVETLSERIQNLRLTRDLLLPRLLSGQVELGVMRGIRQIGGAVQSA